MGFSNCWITADGTLHDQPITIRYRDEVQTELESGKYAQCIQISWSAEQVDPETAYPTADELERIDAFNQKLMAAIEPKAHGLLVMVVMHQGVNQWVLYAADNEEIQQDLNSIPTDAGLYPIEVVTEEDVEWKIFQGLRGAIKTD